MANVWSAEVVSACILSAALVGVGHRLSSAAATAGESISESITQGVSEGMRRAAIARAANTPGPSESIDISQAANTPSPSESIDISQAASAAGHTLRESISEAANEVSAAANSLSERISQAISESISQAVRESMSRQACATSRASAAAKSTLSQGLNEGAATCAEANTVVEEGGQDVSTDVTTNCTLLGEYELTRKHWLLGTRTWNITATSDEVTCKHWLTGTRTWKWSKSQERCANCGAELERMDS